VREQLRRGRSLGASTGSNSSWAETEEISIFSGKFCPLRILVSQHRGKFEGMAGCVGCKASLESWGGCSESSRNSGVMALVKEVYEFYPHVLTILGILRQLFAHKSPWDATEHVPAETRVQGPKGVVVVGPAEVAWKYQEAWKERYGEELDK